MVYKLWATLILFEREVLQMENSFEDRYRDNDIDSEQSFDSHSSTTPYYINDLDGEMGMEGDFASHLVAADDDLLNPKDALSHASLFSSETGALLGEGISIRHNQMDEGIMKDMSSMLAHDLVGSMLLDDAKGNSNLMNACMIHGGLDFASRQELDETMDSLVQTGLLVHAEGGSYRFNTDMDDSNNVVDKNSSTQDEGENIIIHRNAVLFPAMNCSEDLLDKVLELADKNCHESYIKFVHIAEDTTIIAELVNGNETVYHDDLASIVEYLKIDDGELESIVNSELQNDDELSLKIYDNLVAWLNEDSNTD